MSPYALLGEARGVVPVKRRRFRPVEQLAWHPRRR